MFFCKISVTFSETAFLLLMIPTRVGFAHDSEQKWWLMFVASGDDAAVGAGISVLLSVGSDGGVLRESAVEPWVTDSQRPAVCPQSLLLFKLRPAAAHTQVTHPVFHFLWFQFMRVFLFPSGSWRLWLKLWSRIYWRCLLLSSWRPCTVSV